MTIWRIPAKTFLLGEYLAMQGGASIILTTKPCFELRLHQNATMNSIHPDSPAGRFWKDQAIHQTLDWFDPYHGLGGLGASSAEFLGVFRASKCKADLLQTYLHYAWSGVGAKPSGYDVLAQASSGCVFIDQGASRVESLAWPFQDLAFILIHTGQKLKTHEHLEKINIKLDFDLLQSIVEQGYVSFKQNQSQGLVDAVNAYHQILNQMGFVATHTLTRLEQLKKHQEILAMKGCGAMGADVILLLLNIKDLDNVKEKLQHKGIRILATQKELYV